MKKWHQKSIAIFTAAACLLAGGTIGLSQESLSKLQLTAAAETENTNLVGASFGLELEYDYLDDGTLEITKFVSSYSTDVELPSTIEGKQITSIGHSAFSGCSDITSITIPNGVTSIGYWAFEKCSNLTSIIIPDSVKTIGGYAFSNCSSLTDITIPDGVTTIGYSAFADCRKLTSINIPESVTRIGNSAFSNCNSLETFMVDPENPSYTSEDGVLFNKDLTTLLYYPKGKSGAYTIPDGAINIGESAFRGCSNLTDVIIPDSVTTIGASAFSDCINLTSIYLSSGVSNIANTSFSNCSGLEAFIVDAANTSYTSQDGVLFDESMETLLCYPQGKTGTYTIPTFVTSIGYSAFRSCEGLTSVTIPESVTAIGDWAFRQCSNLTSVTLPNSVASIGENAFGYCSQLTDLYYNGTEAEWNEISVGYDAVASSVSIHYEPVVTTTTTTTTMTTTTTTMTTTITTEPETTTESETTTTTQPTTTTTEPYTATTITTTTTTNVYTFIPEADKWNFLNSGYSFGGYDKTYRDGISDSDYSKLMNGLTNIEKARVNGLLYQNWSGSCYGMAVTSILAANGILNPSDWQDGATFLSDIDAPPSAEVKSLINYYMALQKTNVVENKSKTFLFFTEKEKLQILVNCLKDGSPTLLTFWGTASNGNEWGHAVVAYDLQYGTYSINGKAYNGKVLIYDNNAIQLSDDKYDLYFNSSKGTWTIPHYSDANRLGFISDYIGFINYHGYIDTQDDPITADPFIASLQSNSLESNYALTKINFNQDKNSYTFCATEADEIRTFSDFTDNVDENNGDLNFAMRDATKGYELKLDGTEDVDLSMWYENSAFFVTGSNSNVAVFAPSGYVSLKGSDTDYHFNMLYNDGYHTTDWYSFQVEGNHVDAANMKQTEEGYVLHADNLNNVTAQAYNDDANAEITFSTDYTDVLLYEIDEETIGVAVDEDGDGVYETTIAQSDADDTAYGDLNTDNKVDLRDIIVLNKYLANMIQLSDTQMENADCYKDGSVDEKDATSLMKFVLFLTNKLPEYPART